VNDLTPHQHARALLDAHAAGTLDQADQGRLDEHLQRCGTCRAELAGWRAVRAAVRQADTAPAAPPDELERILARAQADAPTVAPGRGRLRGRRLGVLSVAALLLIGAATAAAARIFSTPEELARGQIICTDLDGDNAAFIPAGDRTPIETCTEDLRDSGQPVLPMVACGGVGDVVVLRGTADPQACTRQGLAPLPVEYGQARAKVAQLERDIVAIELAADCIPAEDLARRVQGLLDRESVWSGWRVSIGGDASWGRCGRVSDTVADVDGTTRRVIDGSLYAWTREIKVWRTPPRSAVAKANELYDALHADSGARCFATVASLKAYVQARAATRGLTVVFSVHDAPGLTGIKKDGTGGEIASPAGERFKAGCAVVLNTHVRGDGRVLEVEIVQQGTKGALPTPTPTPTP
jgi:hypothetical protein